MPCRLCLKDEKLCRSHIFPEFMYKPVYDQSRKICSFWTEDARTVPLQKGLREHLLCSPCETRLSALEKYAKSVLASPTPAGAEVGGAFTYSDVDYRRFKLFQMSLIWRAGVSTLPSFAEVRLGSHEKRLRQYILSEDPRAAHEYGCAMFALLRNSNMPESLIVAPKSFRVQSITCYMFVAMGFFWWYPMRMKNIPAELTDLFLKENGTMIVPIRDYTDVPSTVRAVHDLAVALRREHGTT